MDNLHQRAGTKNLITLHGSLFKTKCTQCSKVKENYDSPICPALAGKGAPDISAEDARIPLEDLPRCSDCSGLLRPKVVWFNENLDSEDLRNASMYFLFFITVCSLCI